MENIHIAPLYIQIAQTDDKGKKRKNTTPILKETGILPFSRRDQLSGK